MKAVYALFADYGQAEAAVQDLLEQGFDQEDMNAIVRDYVVKARRDEHTARSGTPHVPEGLDKLLAGQRSVAAVDTGGIHAAGQRAATLAHTAARSGRKGIGDQLIELGIERETADAYLEGVKGGGLLFWIVTDDDHARDAGEILSSHKGMHVILSPAPRVRR